MHIATISTSMFSLSASSLCRGALLQDYLRATLFFSFFFAVCVYISVHFCSTIHSDLDGINRFQFTVTLLIMCTCSITLTLTARLLAGMVSYGIKGAKLMLKEGQLQLHCIVLAAVYTTDW